MSSARLANMIAALYLAGGMAGPGALCTFSSQPDAQSTEPPSSEPPNGTRAYEHAPVLMEAALHTLSPRPGDVVLDGTVGQAGHALAIAPRIQPGGRYIGIDIDPAMLAAARQRLSESAIQADLFCGSYTQFPEFLAHLGLQQVDAMLLDLGVNSAQLDDPARGFSFDRDGPLDMRFDTTQQNRALDLVNQLDERDLADLFYEFGQEGMSRRIARRICQVRHEGRITTTRALARAVESVFGDSGGGKTHPATRVFQALRVAVNRELENLEEFLRLAPERLAPGGRIVVISFHSLEDGIVKRFFREQQHAGQLRSITDRPLVADAKERGRNPRSRSAKLRAGARSAG